MDKKKHYFQNIILVICVCFVACQSNKTGVDSPEKTASLWLNAYYNNDFERLAVLTTKPTQTQIAELKKNLYIDENKEYPFEITNINCRQTDNNNAECTFLFSDDVLKNQSDTLTLKLEDSKWLVQMPSLTD